MSYALKRRMFIRARARARACLPPFVRTFVNLLSEIRVPADSSAY